MKNKNIREECEQTKDSDVDMLQRWQQTQALITT